MNRLFNLFKPTLIIVGMFLLVALPFLPFSPFSWSRIAQFGLLFTLFLLPGTIIASRFFPQIDISYLAFSFFLSYVLYALLASACNIFGLNYDSFYAFFLAITVSTFYWSMKWTPLRMNLIIDRGSVTVALCAAVLVATFFQFPPLNDQGIFDGNILSSYYYRDFKPSAVDVAPFGITIPQPRMRSNLYHAFFGVFGDLMDLDPGNITFHLGNPFLGLFLILGLTSFLWEVSGRRIDPIYLLLAVIFPFSLAFKPGSVYWYYYRFLNGPTLDKDFCLFFLLPMLGVCVYNYLISGQRKWLGVLICAFPAIALSHPFTVIYLLMTTLVLVGANIGRDRWIRAFGLVSLCGLLYGVVNLLVAPAESHAAISRLTEIDWENRPNLRFWGGHYAQPGNLDCNIRFFPGTDIPYLAPIQIFSSPAVELSAWYTLPWAIIVLIRMVICWRRSTILQAFLLALGAGMAAWSVMLLVPDGKPLRISQLIAPGLLSAGALFFMLHSNWFYNVSDKLKVKSQTDKVSHFEVDEGELASLRLQTIYLIFLPLLFVISIGMLAVHLDLWRGIERLHWFYFGFLAFAFTCHYGWSGVKWALTQLFRIFPYSTWATSRLGIVPHVLLLVLCLDQAVASFAHWPSIGKRIGISAYVDHPWYPQRTTYIPPEDRRNWPSWLETKDRVLLLSPCTTCLNLPVRERLVYYPELYSEGHALFCLGEKFLETFFAYDDLVRKKVVTDRVIKFIRSSGVTVVIADDQYKGILESIPGLELRNVVGQVFHVRWEAEQNPIMPVFSFPAP